MLSFGNIGNPFWTREVQFLEKLHQQYASKGLVVVAIALDTDKQAVKAWAEKNKLTLPVTVDTEKLAGAELYRVTALPTTLFIDRSRRVTMRQLGFAKGHEQLFEREVQKIVQ